MPRILNPWVNIKKEEAALGHTVVAVFDDGEAVVEHYDADLKRDIRRFTVKERMGAKYPTEPIEKWLRDIHGGTRA